MKICDCPGCGYSVEDPYVRCELCAKQGVDHTCDVSELERVDHPRHYNSHPSGIEAIVILEQMSFNVGSAMKYLWRAGLKPGAETLEDLKKGLWYVTREIERVEKAGK